MTKGNYLLTRNAARFLKARCAPVLHHKRLMMRSEFSIRTSITRRDVEQHARGAFAIQSYPKMSSTSICSDDVDISRKTCFPQPFRKELVSVMESIKANLHWLLPVALPIGFFAISVGFKFLFGQRDFHFLGGDTAFTGCAVVSATALRQIYFSKLTEPGEIVISILMCGVAFLVAIGCWAMGRHRRLARSIFAMCVGTGCLRFGRGVLSS